ncbi:MAG: SDR family oxidoreductase [Pseudomonadota bacterium]
MLNILVTGATAGIGRATAILLASKGHRVFAAGRNEEALAELDQNHEQITPVPIDVTDDESVASAMEIIEERLGGGHLDVLVNNAGLAVVGPLEAVSMDDWKRQYETNVLGTVRVTKAVLPSMRERRKGRVVNVSSVAGRVTLPFSGPYFSSKHALECISDSLRMEMRPHGVEVVIVEPGAVKTRLGAIEQDQFAHCLETNPPYAAQLATHKAFHKGTHERGADPVSVAGTIVAACESNDPAPRRVVPAIPNLLFVAIGRLLPTRITDWLIRKITQ